MKKLLILFVLFIASCALPKKCCGQFSYKGYDYDIKNIILNIKNSWKYVKA